MLAPATRSASLTSIAQSYAFCLSPCPNCTRLGRSQSRGIPRQHPRRGQMICQAKDAQASGRGSSPIGLNAGPKRTCLGSFALWGLRLDTRARRSLKGLRSTPVAGGSNAINSRRPAPDSGSVRSFFALDRQEGMACQRNWSHPPRDASGIPWRLPLPGVRMERASTVFEARRWPAHGGKAEWSSTHSVFSPFSPGESNRRAFP
jgi:hypothetical protein